MHLCHPTKSLVSALQASQRISRRKAANGGIAGGDTGELGWVPGGGRAAADDGLGWVPGRR
jgi:splicing factor U2AF subunit